MRGKWRDSKDDEKGEHAVPLDLLALSGIAHDLYAPCLNASSVEGESEQGRGEEC